MKTRYVHCLCIFSFLTLSCNSGEFSDHEAIVVSSEIIAHRGFQLNSPENSLESVQAALDAGYSSIEIDVHQTADQQLIIMHDFTLDRTTGLGGRISEIQFSEIEKYNTQNAAHIPTLKEVLDIVSGRAKLIVELKAGSSVYPGIEMNVLKEIMDYGFPHKIAIHSFSDEVLFKFHELDEGIELHKLLMNYYPSINLMIDEGIHFVDIKSYDFVSTFSMNHLFIDEDIVKYLKTMDKKVNVWNLNDASKAEKLDQMGIDGIITDCPEKFRN